VAAGAVVAAGASVAAGAEVAAGAAGAWVAVAGAPHAERIIDAEMINAVKINSFLFMVNFLLVLEFGFFIRQERWYRDFSGGTSPPLIIKGHVIHDSHMTCG
jgi:hypothetical protein